MGPSILYNGKDEHSEGVARNGSIFATFRCSRDTKSVLTSQETYRI